MRRVLTKNLLAASLAITAAVGASSGCADNESMLFVRAVLAQEPGECTVSNDPGSLIQLGGVQDTLITSAYRAPLLIGNQLVERGDRDKLRTETARISLKGAIIEVKDFAGDPVIDFTVDGTGFVDPGEAGTPGYGVMYVDLLPPGLNLYALGRVTVDIRVFGETLGGDEIESNVLSFPITICRGCLISFSAGSIDPLTGTCNLTEGPDDVPCNPGQDYAVDCRICAATNECCTSPATLARCQQ